MTTRRTKVPGTPAHKLEAALRASLKPANHGQTAAVSAAIVAQLADEERAEDYARPEPWEPAAASLSLARAVAYLHDVQVETYLLDVACSLDEDDGGSWLERLAMRRQAVSWWLTENAYAMA